MKYEACAVLIQQKHIKLNYRHMNPVVHFEMPYEDKERMADFYTKAFGWKAQILGPEMGEHVVVHTTETDANNMVQKPGNINERIACERTITAYTTVWRIDAYVHLHLTLKGSSKNRVDFPASFPIMLPCDADQIMK